LALSDWIVSSQLREKRKVTICGQELFDTVGKADRGDAGIVNDGAADSRSLRKFAQDTLEVTGFVQ